MRVANAETTVEQYVSAFNMRRFLNDKLISCLQLFHFPAYTDVYVEEEEQHYLYFLVEGQVQCSHYHMNGKLAVFAVSKPFAAIGDLEILTDEKVHSNVIATEDTVMLGIETAYINRYAADDPRFLRFLIDQLREKLYRTNSLQMSQILPVINRLAVYLLSQSTTSSGAIVLPDKEGLASLLGTTTRHLNRVLKELVEAGCIRTDYPSVYILNRAVLESLSQ